MRTNSIIGAACIFLSLMPYCSCATEPPIPPGLPADVPLNKNAGRGGLVVLTIQLRSGQKLPVIVDTGASCTLLDKSLEPKLGKSVGMDSNRLAGIECRFDFHEAPSLYLDGRPLLMTGPFIGCADLKPLSALIGCRVMGILGMDVLEHYCIQLDFAAGKMRFLDDQYADKSKWGRPFPIVPLLANDARPAVAENLLGMHGPHSLIDSGLLGDGTLVPRYFHQWTNTADSLTNGEVHSPDARFAGEGYPLVFLAEEDWPSDGIGLNFLARHMVTLDFPNHTLYLKRQSIGPLPDARMTEFKPIPDNNPELTARLRAIVRERIDGMARVDDYTASAWRFLLTRQKDIQTTGKSLGDLTSLTLVDRSGLLRWRRSYRYRLEFTRATVLVHFVFDGRNRLSSITLEAIEWKTPAE